MVDTLGNAPSEYKDSDFTGRTASLTGYVSIVVCYSIKEDSLFAIYESVLLEYF